MFRRFFPLLAAVTAALSADAQSTWRFIGPQTIGRGSAASAGRINAIVLDPRDPDRIIVGAGGGGLWKSTDGGANWRAVGDQLPSLIIGALAIDPTDPDIVYAGTGETAACDTCYVGSGLLKSTDGGETWRSIAGPFVDSLGRGARFASIAVHPVEQNVVLAAVYYVGAAGLPGIWRSADGGETWRPVLNTNQGTVVRFRSDEPDVAFAGIFGEGIYRSRDGGRTWQKRNGAEGTALPVENTGIFDLAIAANRPETMYSAVFRFDELGGNFTLFRTEDSGETWTPLPATPQYCQPRCLYAAALAVDPDDPNAIYVAGQGVFRSLDGGSTWANLNRGSTLVTLRGSHHALALPGGSTRIYVGSDSGMFRTEQRADALPAWRQLNETLAVSNFFSFSAHPAQDRAAFAGSLASGVVRLGSDARWDPGPCEDGGAALTLGNDAETGVGSCGRTDLRRTTNGGGAWVRSFLGLNLADRSATRPPLVADPVNPERLYFGTDRVYRSLDGGSTWWNISPSLAEGSVVLTSLAVSPLDLKVMWAGASDGTIRVTENANADLFAFWEQRSTGLPVSRTITSIAPDWRDWRSAWIATSGWAAERELPQVLRTTDQGLTWSAAGSGLPNAPVFQIVADPDLPGVVFAATFQGVYRLSEQGRWDRLGEGLPNAVVHAIHLQRASRRLQAATHGRGVWEVDVPLPTGVPPATAISRVSPSGAAVGSPPTTLTVEGSGFLPGASVVFHNQLREATFESSSRLTVQLSRADLEAPLVTQVSVSNPGTPPGPSVNSLPFVVTPQPEIDAASFADGASLTARPVAVGSVATISGRNLAVREQRANAPPFSSNLSGTTLRLWGIPVPLLAVSPTRLTFQVPWELVGFDAVDALVSVGPFVSARRSLRLAPFSPGIFTRDGSGSGQGEIYVEEGNNVQRLAAPEGVAERSRPAEPGELISIFGTGLGPVTDQPPTAIQAAANPLSAVRTPISVFFGEVQVGAVFSALAPGLVGVYQVQVRVPTDAPRGDAVPVQIAAEGARSQAVTMAIR